MFDLLDSVPHWLLENAIVAGALAVLVAVICRYMRPRPAIGHALWGLVLLKLIVPPGLVGTWTLPAVTESSAAAVPVGVEAVPRAVPAPIATDELVAMMAEALSEPSPDVPPSALLEFEAPSTEASPTDASPTDEASADGDSIAPAPATETNWRAWLFVLWGAGALATLAWLACRVVRFRFALGDATPASAAVVARVAAVAERLGVRAPAVFTVDCRTSPFVWGVLRPRLVLPRPLLDGLSDASFDAVLAHELAHIKRRDPLIGWLLLPATCLWWWNPVFWWACRRLHEFAELACDAWVIWAYPDRRRSYADTLIEVSLMTRASRPTPAPGMGARAFEELERRFQMIMHPTTRRSMPRWSFALIAIGAAVILPGVTFGQSTTTSAAPQPTKAWTVEASRAPVAVRSVLAMPFVSGATTEAREVVTSIGVPVRARSVPQGQPVVGGDDLVKKAKRALDQGRYAEAMKYLHKLMGAPRAVGVQRQPATRYYSVPGRGRAQGYAGAPAAPPTRATRPSAAPPKAPRAPRAPRAVSATSRPRRTGGGVGYTMVAPGQGGGSGTGGGCKACDAPSAQSAPRAWVGRAANQPRTGGYARNLPGAVSGQTQSGGGSGHVSNFQRESKRLRALEREVERLAKLIREMKSGGTQL